MDVFIRPGNEKDAIMCIIVLIGMVALFSMVKGEK
jgi:hypothetical protein